MTQPVTLEEQIERLQAQLAERDARWFALLEATAQIVWATDATGNYEQDLQLEKLAHLTWTQFTGEPIVYGSVSMSMEPVHVDDRDRVMATWQECLSTGQNYRCEFRLRHRSGAWRWMLFRGAPIRDTHGVITAWSGIGTDITQRREVEDALRESQQRLMTALDVGGIGIVSVRLIDQSVWWDDTIKKLWNINASDVSDRSIESMMLRVVHQDDYAQVRSAIQTLVSTRQPAAIEYRAKQHDGSIKWIAAHSEVRCDSHDNPTQIISAHIDITKLKVAEQSLRQAQTMQALGTLAGGVAHDFNNLLLTISGNAQLALDCSVHPEAISALNEINKATDRATDLVRRILTFSSQQPRDKTSAALDLAVNDALRLTQTTWPSNIHLATQLSEREIAVKLGAAEIQQIIVSLISNAIYAIGDQPGVIEIITDVAVSPYTDKLTTSAVLRVRDNGCGMDAATRARIFEPFFTTKPMGKGTGLGLAVVHGIVQSCGGAIDIDSTSNIGTVFTVWLPLASPTSGSAAENAASKPTGHGERILYVDDDEAIVLLITRVLQHSGYSVTGHTDAQQAIKELADNPQAFDVVVTDLSMPAMSGFDLAAQVKRIRPSLPIVMTSGYVRTQDQEQAQALGIEHIILKPNTIEELGQVLDKICRTMRA